MSQIKIIYLSIKIVLLDERFTSWMAVQADWQRKVAKRAARKVKSSIILLYSLPYEKVQLKPRTLTFVKDNFNSCVRMWTAM